MLEDQPATDIDLDLFAPVDAVDYETLGRLRESCPVARTTSGWLVTGYEPIVAAAKAVDTFVASFRQAGVVVPAEEQFINEIPEPRHGRIRKVINASVAHHRAMPVEPFVRSLCEEYLAPVLEAGRGELIGELISPIPINVIAHLLGVPRDDWERFRRWSDEVVEGTYPTLYRNERGEGLAGAHPEFTSYVDGLIAERRASAERVDDLLDRLLYTEIQGQRLTDVEVRTQLVFLLISGNETTRHLIANLLAIVATDPELFERLKTERDLVDRAVEETLRLMPPIHVLLRNVVTDTDALGRSMCPGDKTAFGLAAANRDDSVFPDPDDFKLDRPNHRDHLSFGDGPHVCPGSALARLEARVVLDTILDQVDELVPEPGWEWTKTPVFWANGPVDLPVRCSRRPSP